MIFGRLEIFQIQEIDFMIFVMGCGWWKDSKKNIHLWFQSQGVGGPSNFIVNQSPNPWIWTLSLDNKSILRSVCVLDICLAFVF